MRISAIVATLTVIHSFAAAAPSVPRGLPFHLTPQGGVIVRVFLDAHGPVQFLVDTGSNGSSISEDLASALGLPIVARTALLSAIGQKPRLMTRIEHLAMDGISVTDVLATITPEPEFALPDIVSAAGRIQGVIGQDVLASLRYTIDYRARRIIWWDAPAAIPRDAALLTLESRNDRFVAVLPQEREAIRLVPDSGAETLVLFRRNGHTGPLVTSTDKRTVVTGLAGSRDARLARVNGLRIGSTIMTDVPAVVVENAPGVQTSDGLLPLHIFARVTFNGPEKQLIIEQR